MRTTVTIDDDIARRLEDLRIERGVGFKRALNDVLRVGLAAERAPASPPLGDSPTTAPIDLGRELIDVSNVSAALALAEGDRYG